jgi:Fe-S cluster assembly protein SufD
MSASVAMQSFAAQWRQPADSGLAQLRREAMQRFEQLGLPTMRDESWRYTSLRALSTVRFTEAKSAAIADLARLSWLRAGEWPSLVLVNGHRVTPYGAAENAPGIEVMGLAEMARSDPGRLLSLLPALSDAEHRRWTLLNTALFTDGLYIRFTGRSTTPLIILHVAAAGNDGEVSYPRVIVDADRHAQGTLIEHHVDSNTAAMLCNSVTTLNLNEGANLEHFRVFSTPAPVTHTDHLQVRQGRDSHCRQHTVVLGGGLVRANLEVDLAAELASLQSYSLLAGHETRHVDCMNRVTHAALRTTSRQTARAIASGRSRVIFNSEVVVNAGAQKSDSRQSCRGLLLSPHAEIDSRPQLQIHADDVKCAHGATTGRLDPDMLFYLLSRGLDRGTAQSLLIFAFLADVLSDMSLPARGAIEAALIAQLPDSDILQKFR